MQQLNDQYENLDAEFMQGDSFPQFSPSGAKYSALPVIILEGQSEPLDYESCKIEINCDFIKTNDPIKNSLVIVGKVEGTIVMKNGDVIKFSRGGYLEDGSIFINQPYYYEGIL